MQRISPEELDREREKGNVCIVDVRSDRVFDQSNEHIPGDVRHSPDVVEKWWDALPKDRHIVLYCT